MKKFRNFIIFVSIIAGGIWLARGLYQDRVYQQIIARLQAESRVAQVLVTQVQYDEAHNQPLTTIKFLEFDTAGRPLEPQYFTFNGNIIQFQSLVVRFDDRFVAAGDRLKGKSAYLFWKVFALDKDKTQEFEIAKLNEIPGGYKTQEKASIFEQQFWREFWQFAFDPAKAQRAGIKSVQIEAPGVMFIPGYLYTINIEHDGGLRIDTKPLPAIMRGEQIP